MTDLRLDLFEDGADLTLERGDLLLAAGIGEAVLVSLFSDARASADELAADGTSDPRGWWGEDPPDRMGSKLWLLSRTTLSELTITRVGDYCREALAWMRQLGVAEEVTVEVTPLRERGEIDVEIVIRRGSAREWSELWAGIVAGTEVESTIGDSRLRIVYR